jgi:hypothetical protein
VTVDEEGCRVELLGQALHRRILQENRRPPAAGGTTVSYPGEPELF